MNTSRQPKGTQVGGQFAAGAKAGPAGVRLAPEPVMAELRGRGLRMSLGMTVTTTETERQSRARLVAEHAAGQHDSEQSGPSPSCFACVWEAERRFASEPLG